MILDFLNQELNIGDVVIYIRNNKTSSWLDKGVVTKLMNIMIKVDDIKINPSKTIKIKNDKIT